MTSPGVFICTNQSDEEVIKACQQQLHRMKSDAKIVAVKREDTYEGVKVFFSCESVVLNFLKKKFLFDRDHPSIPWEYSTIHSLTTTFTVQNAFPTLPKEFGKVLQNGMAILGPILEVSMIPISQEFPDIGSGKWRVVLDVPEVEDFDVFKNNGLPDDMFLKLPGLKERLSIKFHCRFCEVDGHSQWRCNDDGDSTIVDEEDSSSKQTAMASTSRSSFRIRDIQIESVASCSRSKSGLKTSDVKEFEKRLGMEEAYRYTSSGSIGEIAVKTERDDTKTSKKGSAAKRRLSSGSGDGNAAVVPQRARSTSSNESSFSEEDEDAQPGLFSRASSTTADQDTARSTLEGSSKTKRDDTYQWLPPSLFEHRKSISEDSGLVTTSNQPEQTHYIKSELQTTDDESDANQRPPAATKIVRKRKLPTQGVPVVIPDRIKEIARKNQGVLNVDQLEAFCNHVKKKSTPADFATMYTNNVEGLKVQLDQISSQYYLTKKIGTKTEIQFMKWFRGMRERFYGTPVRRRNPKT